MDNSLLNKLKILNYINDAVYINKVNQNLNIPGNFIFVNKAAIDKMNYSFEEFMELTPTDLEGTSLLEKNPNILKKLKENKNMVFETKHVAKTGEKYEGEISSKIIKLDILLTYI